MRAGHEIRWEVDLRIRYNPILPCSDIGAGVGDGVVTAMGAARTIQKEEARRVAPEVTAIDSGLLVGAPAATA